MIDTKKTTVSQRELRQFGFGLALVGGLGGGIALLSGHSFGVIAILSGLFLATAFWFDAPGIRPLYRAWMALGRALGRGLLRIILTLLYLLLLTPLALIGRACGQIFIERGFRQGQTTYWVTAAERTSRQSCEKQS